MLHMKMLPPHSEQKKTWKTDRAFGITRTNIRYCDKITTFGKLNLLLQSIWLLGHYYLGTIITRKVHGRPWDEFFTAGGSKKICSTNYKGSLRPKTEVGKEIKSNLIMPH